MKVTLRLLNGSFVHPIKNTYIIEGKIIKNGQKTDTFAILEETLSLGGRNKTKKIVLSRPLLMNKRCLKVRLFGNFVKSANAKSAFSSFTPIAQAYTTFSSTSF
jgi:hypothetical protein